VGSDQRHDHQVHAQEPQRLAHHLADQLDRASGQAEPTEDEREHQPDDHEDDHRPQQPRDPARQVFDVPTAATLHRLPAHHVGEAADQEEQRHDLEHPARQPQPRGSRQHVPSSKGVGGATHGGDRPVAEDHGRDARHPQEVDVAVPPAGAASARVRSPPGRGGHGCCGDRGGAAGTARPAREPRAPASIPAAAPRRGCCGAGATS
jgi:hypothetical protein